MEQEEIKKAIIERFNSLQPEIQDLIISTNYEETLYSISQGHKLTDEQFSNLELNTTLVLLGNTHPSEYKNELTDILNTSQDEIEKIVSEVNEKILNKVLPILIQNFEEDEKSEIITNENKGKEYKQNLYEIGAKFKLPVDQIGEIDILTDNFLSGKISSIDYEKSISDIVVIPSEKKIELIKEINDSIIKPRRDAMVRGESGTIKKEELVMKNNSTVPLPPKVSIPLPPYATSDKQNVLENNGGIIKNENQPETPKPIMKVTKIETIPEIVKSETTEDVYKEHGIEILSNNETKTEEVVKQEKPVNIITSKLFENTASKTTVNDYSLPKITPLTKPSTGMVNIDIDNPHDAYREII